MIGDRLREVRTARHLSLSDVAGKADISAATLSRIENGKQGIDLELFLSLLKILRIQPSEVLENDGAVSMNDRLVDQISALDMDQRARLWRDLATSRRTQRTRPSDARALGEKVEELVAQVEYLREEIEAVRAKRRR